MFTLNSNGLSLFRNLDLTEEELMNTALSFSSKNGEIREKLLHWGFGPVMTMKFDPEARNYLFSDEEVPFHWDGAFYKEPTLLLFYCLESEGKGGETTFTDTGLLWESLTLEEKRLCESVTLTYETEKKAHYGGKITVPLVQKHPVTGKTILRLAERVESQRNPVALTITGPRDAEAFYKWLTEKLYDPKFYQEHEWKKGDLLVVDNFTFLHGRRSLGENKKRTFKRIQIL